MNYDGENLLFPESMVIYLDSVHKVPKCSELTIIFPNGSKHIYRIPNFLYQEHEIRELNQKKMVALIPFQLLKVRDIIGRKRTEENLKLLKGIILDDIIGSINENLKFGSITIDDAEKLKELSINLYRYISKHYDKLGGYSDMKPLLEGAMELPLDKYRIKIDELEAEVEKVKQQAEAEKQQAEAEKQQAEAENKLLRKRIEELEKTK